jgi:elongation factor P hydroxylase
MMVGGAAEPLYEPHQMHADGWARLHFRQDFAASALHEAAHWCIAGAQRRAMVDFGYWYHPDGRNAEQQQEFYQFEVKPQALEWLLADAAGVSFNISADNLAGFDPKALGAFTQAVHQQKAHYLDCGLPPRAQRLVTALLNYRRTR